MRGAVHHQPVLRPRVPAVVAQVAEPDAAAGTDAVGGGAPAPTQPAAPAPAQRTDGRKLAVSGLQPQGEATETFVGVPPPGSQEAPRPTFLQKARAPFMGLTLLATMGITAWQSNKMYERRQEALLDDFAATMVFHLGDEREMKATLATFRNQLGPGRYTGRMFQAFLKNMATNVPIGAPAVRNLQLVVQLFKLTDSASAKLLEAVADDIARQPSVLGKLTFLAERAMPMPSSIAKLRTKFPNWSFDTVTALQRAMLENLYRDLIADGSQPSSDDLAVLGLSEAEAKRLSEEVEAQKEAERLAAEEKAAEEARALELERMLEQAAMADSKIATRSTRSYEDDAPPPSSPSAPPSAPPPPPSSSSDEPPMAPFEPPQESRGEGTHEFECTDCGYIMFPAAGREFKFFGDDFKCPQCGSDKTAFVDNGVVDD